MVTCWRASALWLVFVLLSAPVHGQTSTGALPTSVDVLVLPATGDPTTVAPIATRTTTIGTLNTANGTVTGNAQCGRSPLADPAIPLVSPTTAEFDDPFAAGKKCVALLPIGLPDGAGYRAVMIATAPTCQPTAGGKPLTPCPSQRSLVGTPPFSVASVKTPPAALTGLVVRP